MREKNVLASLAVGSVCVATWAVLLDLKAVRVVTTVLLGDVVTFLALNACERDLGTDIALGHDRAFQLSGPADSAASWCCGACAERSGNNRTAVVARAGLEPATQRL